MASKKISLSAEVDITPLAVQVTGAPGGAGVAVAYSTASSAVILTNTSSIANIQYKIDAGTWTDLTRQSGISFAINFAASVLYLRRTSLEGGDEYAHLAIEAVPVLKAGVSALSLGGGGGAGTPGADGKTILNGTGAPSAGLGNNGDFYIDTAANVIYGPKATGAWPGSGVSIAGSGSTLTVASDATANFNVVLANASQIIPVNSASAVTATIQPDTTLSLPVGFNVALYRKGLGGVSFVAGGGVTIRTAYSLAARNQYSTISALKTGANEWLVSGDLT